MHFTLVFSAIGLGAASTVASIAVDCAGTSYNNTAVKAVANRSCQIIKSYSSAVDGPCLAYAIPKSGTISGDGHFLAGRRCDVPRKPRAHTVG